jgi:hypothetical protein
VAGLNLTSSKCLASFESEGSFIFDVYNTFYLEDVQQPTEYSINKLCNAKENIHLNKSTLPSLCRLV